jgi:hypothetical protein
MDSAESPNKAKQGGRIHYLRKKKAAAVPDSSPLMDGVSHLCKGFPENPQSTNSGYFPETCNFSKSFLTGGGYFRIKVSHKVNDPFTIYGTLPNGMNWMLNR